MRHITNKGLSLIKSYENFSSQVYFCPAGYSTIGYGHLIISNDEEKFLNGITEQEAIELLQQDIQIAEKAVLKLINVPLTDNQFDALISFTFNLGSGALQRSTLRQKVNREEHEEAAAEFLKWIWAGSKKLKGLIRRRQAESIMYLT